MHTIVCDGGTGPGNGTARAECYGSYTIDGGEQQWCKFPMDTTNNQAEYDTLLAALDKVVEIEDPAPVGKVLALTDSKLVVKQVKGDWAAQDLLLRRRRNAVRKLCEARGIELKMKWVPREFIVARLGH